jgi:hypothetical protein
VYLTSRGDTRAHGPNVIIQDPVAATPWKFKSSLAHKSFGRLVTSQAESDLLRESSQPASARDRPRPEPMC